MDDYKPEGIPDFDPADVITSEVIEHVYTNNDRSIARRVALQVLYEVDSADHKVGEVISEQLSHHHLRSKASRYVNMLVLGVIEHHRRLDSVIRHFAPEFPLNQVAIIDRNILRIAILEFAVLERVPVKVAVDEAIELAKLFGADGSARFVNGVLGTAFDDLEMLKHIIKQPDPDDAANAYDAADAYDDDDAYDLVDAYDDDDADIDDNAAATDAANIDDETSALES